MKVALRICVINVLIIRIKVCELFIQSWPGSTHNSKIKCFMLHNSNTDKLRLFYDPIMEPNKVMWTYCGWNSSDVRLYTNPKGP